MNREEFLESLEPETRMALRRSTDWRLMSLLLERPHGRWRSEVESVAVEVSDPDLRTAATLARSATEEMYLAFLGPGAPATPREVGYAGFEDPGRLLADVQSFYTAFSYAPRAEDPPDHIAVEAGFIGFLALKEVYALLSEDEDAALVTRSAMMRFQEEHFARLARGLAEKLSGGGPAYLSKTLAVLLRRMEHIPAVPRPADATADPLAAGCPMAGQESDPEMEAW